MTDATKGWPDRTRRAYDVIATHYIAQGPHIGGHWVAIRLSDGGSDGVLYDSKPEATRHQLHETQCAYICLPPFGEMSIGEIHRYLELNDMIYAQGGRLSDVDTHIVPSAFDRPVNP